MTIRTDVPEPGNFAIVGGRVHAVASIGEDTVSVSDDPSLPAPYRRVDTRRGRVVDVPRSDLDRYFKRTVEAEWHGGRVAVTQLLTDDRVAIAWEGGGDWPTSVGLTGDQYSGWTGPAPAAELSDIRASERDLPLDPA